ncbi:MAG: SMC-Scp complex subunit ScpB [Anaerolineae bacterium]|nr:SMC-Scp complex subunit ScpB [Anaerolineae bacterium]
MRPVERTLELKALLESLLLVADRPVTVEDLSAALEVSPEEIAAALATLDAEYVERGLRIQRKGERLQLVSAPEAGPAIERFLGLEISGRLSNAALETLSIIAYRQPVTRAQIEAVRGVQSDGILRSLTRRGLIEGIERADTVGRPILYGTTFEFLQQFGLQSVRDLPDWPELEREIEEREDQAS